MKTEHKLISNTEQIYMTSQESASFPTCVRPLGLGEGAGSFI